MTVRQVPYFWCLLESRAKFFSTFNCVTNRRPTSSAEAGFCPVISSRSSTTLRVHGRRGGAVHQRLGDESHKQPPERKAAQQATAADHPLRGPDRRRAALSGAAPPFSLLDDVERGVRRRDGALAGRERLSVSTTYGHYRLPPSWRALRSSTRWCRRE